MIPERETRTYDAPAGFSAFSGPRKCASCRFWRDAGIASSGWCVHPESGPSRDVALVRGAELACRDGQDRDLWEPQERPAPRLRLVVGDEIPVSESRERCYWPKFPPPVRPRRVITERIEEVV